MVPHGCAEGEPPPPPGTEVQNTTLMSVQIPDGVTITGVEEARGFETSQDEDAVTWSAGDLENGDPGEFAFTATLAGDDGEALSFSAFQECSGGLEYRWAGNADAATPAPVVTIGELVVDDSTGTTADAVAGAPTDPPVAAPEIQTSPTPSRPTPAASDPDDNQAPPSGGIATGVGGATGGSLPVMMMGTGLVLAGVAGIVLLRRRDPSDR